MTQKITLVLVTIVAIASAAACGLMWNLAQDFREVAAQAQQASQELLAQGRDANQELLKQNQAMMAQLATLADRPVGTDVISDWFPLLVRVVKNDEAKTPAQGFQVHLNGPHVSDSDNSGVRITTDENGIADFGKVRSGHFNGTITAPWGEGSSFGVTVKPGTHPEKEVTCPAGPPKSIEAKPVVNWPKELQGKDIALVIHVSRSDATTIGQRQWMGGSDKYLLIRPDSRFACYDHVSQDFYGSSARSGGAASTGEAVEFYSKPEIHQETFSWRGQEAAFSQLSIVQLAEDADFPTGGESLPVLNRSRLIDQFSSRTPAIRRGGEESFTRTLFIHKAQGEGVQEWPIEIRKEDVIVARALLAPGQFPDLNAGYVSYGALNFFVCDKDNNLELSEEEYEFNTARISYEEFPVPYEKFVTDYVESRTAKLRGGRGGSSAPR